MSKLQYDAVKELIAEKKYADARVVLKVMDDPRARQWEAKLNQIDPPSFRILKNSLRRKSHLKRNVIVIILVAVVLSLFVLNMLGEFSPLVVHARQTQVAQNLALISVDLTDTAYFVNNLVKPTATYTVTPTPLPTPVVEVTLVMPRTFWVSSALFMDCPRRNCSPNNDFENEAVTVVGIAYGEWVSRSNVWYKIQFLKDGILVDGYAPSVDFSEHIYQ